MDKSHQLIVNLLPLVDQKRLEDVCFRKQLSQICNTVLNDNFEILQKLSSFQVDQDYGNSHYTIKTLAFYARQDSPVEYNTWHTSWILNQPKNWIKIPKIIYREFWLEYVYAPNGCNNWYKFEENRWRRIQEAEVLREFSHYLAEKAYRSSDISFIKFVLEGASKLFSKDSVLLKIIKQYFSNHDFPNWLDSDTNLIALNGNKVLELVNNKIICRDGLPEDYLFKHSRTYFDPRLSWDHSEVQFMMNWLKQTFEKKSLIDDFLRTLSDLLFKRTSKVIVFVGKGGNSKSSWQRLIHYLLGGYSVLIDGGVPNDPHIRVGWLLDPEYHEMETYFHSKIYTPIMVTNEITVTLDLHHITGKNRTDFEFFRFNSKWSLTAPETEVERYQERHYLEDRNFIDRVKQYAKYLLWILINTYNRNGNV